jgi:hypothetical protein
VSEERTRRDQRGGNRWGCGCASVGTVLIVGLLLSAFSADVGIGVSVRVPFTNSNLSLAGSVGKKDHVVDVLPPYLRDRLGGNQNFINQSATLTIWVAEGTQIFVLGHQEGAPVLDLHIAGHSG